VRVRHKNGVEGYEELKSSSTRLARFFRLFALPARVVILEILLSESDWIEASQFQLLPLSYGAIETHLRELRKEKLIERRIINNVQYYRADFQRLGAMTQPLPLSRK
jgi:DNA-binding transcriptional ArsR family regulator